MYVSIAHPFVPKQRRGEKSHKRTHDSTTPQIHIERHAIPVRTHTFAQKKLVYAGGAVSDFASSRSSLSKHLSPSMKFSSCSLFFGRKVCAKSII